MLSKEEIKYKDIILDDLYEVYKLLNSSPLRILIYPALYRKESIIATLINNSLFSKEAIATLAEQAQSLFIKNHKGEYEEYEDELCVNKFKEDISKIIKLFDLEIPDAL